MTRQALGGFFSVLALLGVISCQSVPVAPLAPAPVSAGRESSAFSFNRGVGLFNKGQWDQAIAEFNQAVEANPGDAEAHTYLGSAYLKKDKLELAIAEYTKALAINPRYVEVYTDRGVAYGSKGENNRALADFNKAIEINPRYAPAWSCRGVIYLSQGQYDRAISDFSKAVEVNPKYMMGYNNRGTAYLSQKRYDQAIADFNKAVELYSRNALPYVNRGLAYYEKGQYDSAISDLSKALQIEPGFASAYETRAQAYTKKGEYDKAWKDVDQAQRLGVKVDPDFLRALNSFSSRPQANPGASRGAESLSDDDIILYPFQARAKKFGSGQARERESLEKKFPEGAYPSIRLGGPIGKVQKLPSRLSEKHHETIMKARELYARKQYREAAALLRPALQDEPGNLFIMEDLARTLFRIHEERPESFRLYKRLVDLLDAQTGAKDRPGVISLDAWFMDAYWKLGCLYLDRREYDKAVFEISRAIMFVPRSGPLYEQALSYLCEAYYFLGNYRFAKYLGHRVLEINPNNKYVLEYLGKMKGK